MADTTTKQLIQKNMTSNWGNIPAELKTRNQWVLWKLVERKTPKGVKKTKIPFQINGKSADSTNPETWATFEQVVSAFNNNPGMYSGIGFVFSEDDPYLGIDIDDCIHEDISPEAKAIIEKVASYTETSQSGTGIHMIVKAKLPGERNRKGPFEFYQSGRYFVMTGNVLEGTPLTIADNQKGVDEAYSLIFSPERGAAQKQIAAGQQEQAATAQDISFDDFLGDNQIIEIASRAKNGYKFYSLYRGDWQSHFQSQSEADQAFCNMLAFYTKDPAQIDRIVRSSGLYRDKWDRDDYRNTTIERALRDTTGSYTGKKNTGKVINLPVKDSLSNDVDKPSSRASKLEEFEKLYPLLGEKLYNIGYDIDSQGRLCIIKEGRGGNCYLDPIANFIAWPVKEIQKDNGIEKITKFEIMGVTADGYKLPKAMIPADKFAQMQWTLDNWGIKAVIYPGNSARDKVRYVIQTLGVDAPREQLYGHLGWRQIGDKWVYLHAGGAIGDDSVIVDVEDEGLTAYEMPSKVDDVKAAVELSLKTIEIAPKTTTIPLLALIYLAPLCEPLRKAGIEPAFILWLSGTTGSMKSTLAALFLSHYGKFNGKNLPASFKDTANALERKGFFTKDSIMVVDDYHPNASISEANKMRETAERLLRIYGDRTGRGRLNADSTAKKTYIPKGLCLVTGEDHPDGGQSAAARYLGIDLERGDVNKDLLTEIQGKTELLGQAMRHFICSLEIDTLPEKLKETFIRLRTKASKEGQHSRIPEVIAWLQIGYKAALDHAYSVGVITEVQRIDMLLESWDVFLKLAERQGKIVEGETPEQKFVIGLRELLDNNTLTTVEAINGKPLLENFVGWYDKDWYYLLPGTAYNAVTKYYQARGTQLPVTEKVLWKHLEQAGYIKTEHDGQQIRRTLRRTFGGERFTVLQLRKSVLDEVEDTRKPIHTQERMF
jgi:hypothetical protein